MGKGSTFDSDLLQLIFCAKAIANIADNAASSPLTNIAVALHTADPSGGTQTSNEANYTGYARQTVARTTVGWVISGSSQVSPGATITFPQATASATSTITYASVGTSTSGAGKILYSGALSPVINISQNVTPQLSTSSVISEQ